MRLDYYRATVLPWLAQFIYIPFVVTIVCRTWALDLEGDLLATPTANAGVWPEYPQWWSQLVQPS